LNNILKKSKYYKYTSISDIKIISNYSNLTSNIVRIEILLLNKERLKLFIKYSKKNRSEVISGIEDNEIIFYNFISNEMPKPPILECYDAFFSPDSKQFHIILPDLSDTHYIINGMPSEKQSNNIIKNYAKVHSFWWDKYKFIQEIKSQTIIENFTIFMNNIVQYYPRYIDFLGDLVTIKHKKIYENIFNFLPKILGERIKKNDNLTLIQQDANFGNVLFPKNMDNDIYIIDWQFWRIGMGTEDLVCLFSLTNNYEYKDIINLLKFYIFHLNEYGINKYGYDNCLYDYKMSILKSCLNPIYQFSIGLSEISKSIFSKVFLAFKNFNCEDMY
jgi:hypothetical protein